MLDDFCLTHGRDFMKPGNWRGAVPTCTKCEEERQYAVDRENGMDAMYGDDD